MRAFEPPLVCLYSLLVIRMRLLLVTTFQACVDFDNKKIYKIKPIFKTILVYHSIRYLSEKIPIKKLHHFTD